MAVQHFITNDKVNVAGLVLAGSADFKTELSQSDLLDPRLQAKIVKIVDVSYGMEVGWQQAIDLSSEALSNVKFVQEKKLIQKYFDEIAQDTGKYIYGVDDTLKTLELGAVETLIVWENLELTRHTLRNAAGGEFLSGHLVSKSYFTNTMSVEQKYISCIHGQQILNGRRSSRTMPRGWKWKLSRKQSLCLNGWLNTTKSSVVLWNSCRTSRRKDHSSSRASLVSVVS
jgi:hypothetical protein